MVARRLPPARTRLEAGPEGRLGLGSGAHSVGRAHARGGGAAGPRVELRRDAAYLQLKVEHRPGVHKQRPVEEECGYLGRPPPRRAISPSL